MLPHNNLQLLSRLVVICEELWITKSNQNVAAHGLKLCFGERFEVTL
jgi:hypothetical protein